MNTRNRLFVSILATILFGSLSPLARPEIAEDSTRSRLPVPRNLGEILAASVEVVSSQGLGSGVVIGTDISRLDMSTEGEEDKTQLSTPDSQLSPPTLVLTAYHLVSTQEEPVLVSGQPADVIRKDPANDLALLRVRSGFAGPGLPLAQEMPKIGARLYIIGNALGTFADTFSEGLLVNTDRIALGIKVWQVTGLAFPGQSGGAVVNEQGELVGLLSMLVGNTPGLGFVIPLPTIRNFLNQVTGDRGRVTEESEYIHSCSLSPVTCFLN